MTTLPTILLTTFPTVSNCISGNFAFNRIKVFQKTKDKKNFYDEISKSENGKNSEINDNKNEEDITDNADRIDRVDRVNIINREGIKDVRFVRKK